MSKPVMLARYAASEPGSIGRLTDRELLQLIADGVTLGIPATSPTPIYSGGARLFPRSLDVNGLTLTVAEQSYRFDGPFGPVITLHVRNTDATYSVIFRDPDTLLGNACRVLPGEKRVIEFDTPTDHDVPVSTLDLRIKATGTMTAPCYFEVS